MKIIKLIVIGAIAIISLFAVFFGVLYIISILFTAIVNSGCITYIISTIKALGFLILFVLLFYITGFLVDDLIKEVKEKKAK